MATMQMASRTDAPNAVQAALIQSMDRRADFDTLLVMDDDAVVDMFGGALDSLWDM